MASNNSSIFLREQLLCSICLDVLVQPVSTPCGHNFCMNCISTYWDSTTDCRCPICKEHFKTRPNLKINTFILEVVTQFQLQQLPEIHARPVAVPAVVVEAAAVGGGHNVRCDVCPGDTQDAFMSCVQCQRSYCHAHLEAHETDGTLRAHTLMAPLENLEVWVCQEHHRLRLHFCRDDGQLLCDTCASGRHAGHHFVPVEKACQEKRSVMVHMEARALMMMDKQREKVGALKEAVTQDRADTRDVLGKFAGSFGKLLSELLSVRDWLEKVTQEKQKAHESRSDKMIVSIEKEIVQLRSTVEKMQELKNTKDQLPLLLQDDVALPLTEDLQVMSRSTLTQDVRMSVKTAVSKMQELVGSMSRDMEVVWSTGGEWQAVTPLQDLLQYQEEVSLDPDTAHPLLLVSEDRKQVRYGLSLIAAQVPKPSMFTEHLAVLGTRGFSSQRFYFQVFVGHKTEWCLGVATASIQTRGPLTRSASIGLWAIWFLRDRFEAYSCPDVPVHIGRVELVGVFVDYQGSKVSFYNVQTEELIYSFTDCNFREELVPYFNPCDNEFGFNLEPLVIVPVSPTDD